jgi:hypothetical protein
VDLCQPERMRRKRAVCALTSSAHLLKALLNAGLSFTGAETSRACVGIEWEHLGTSRRQKTAGRVLPTPRQPAASFGPPGRNYRRHHLLCKRQGAARPTPGIPPGATRLTELANGSGVLESQRCPPARTGALACRLSASGRSARSTKASPSCPARRREALGPRRASGRRTSGIACGATTGRRVEEMESSGYGTQSAASRVRA